VIVDSRVDADKKTVAFNRSLVGNLFDLFYFS